jgi:uncharacterized protein YjbI with pentapeptide repeats
MWRAEEVNGMRASTSKEAETLSSMHVVLFDILRHDLLLSVFLSEKRKDTMKARRRLWWALSGIFLFSCVGFVSAAYRFGWSTTGFLEKSLWDWLQLLIVPFVLAFGALVFQLANTRTESHIAQQRYEQDQKIALDKQHEDLLQAYLDRVAELLLEKKLGASDPLDSIEVRQIARVRTITILTQVNAQRIGYIFTFLREAELMSTAPMRSIVSLEHADLRAVEWGKATLINADLRRADLRGANLSNADLSGASLNGANLRGANLTNADLRGANLTNADLREATLINADLSRATLTDANLRGANLSNADLRRAELSGAALSTARLRGAKLSGAALNKTKLNGADLSTAAVTEEQLKEAESLEGATLPDGSTHAS